MAGCGTWSEILKYRKPLAGRNAAQKSGAAGPVGETMMLSEDSSHSGRPAPSIGKRLEDVVNHRVRRTGHDRDFRVFHHSLVLSIFK